MSLCPSPQRSPGARAGGQQSWGGSQRAVAMQTELLAALQSRGRHGKGFPAVRGQVRSPQGAFWRRALLNSEFCDKRSWRRCAGWERQQGAIARAGEGGLRAEWPVRFCAGYKLTGIVSRGSK